MWPHKSMHKNNWSEKNQFRSSFCDIYKSKFRDIGKLKMKKLLIEENESEYLANIHYSQWNSTF